MKSGLYLISLICLTLSSCYFIDDIFDPPEPIEESLQQRSEKSIGMYLKNKVNQKYKPYGFGKLTIKKPIELVELDKLKRKRENSSQEDNELDSSIIKKERFIQQNRIEKTLELDHFFTLTDSLGRTKIFETTFKLNDTLKVFNLSGSIMVSIPADFREVLTYYFYEYPIFLTSSYEQSKKLSRDFYAFFKTELEVRKSLESKSDFLLHTLNMCYQVKENGVFNQQKILEKNVLTHIETNRKNIKEYKPLSFSDLYESNSSEEKIKTAYYFFHKFIGNYKDQLDTNVVLVEFSPYYEISNIYQMERPFNQYFN